MGKVIAIATGFMLIAVVFIAGVAKKAIKNIAEFMDDSFRWG